ncbi:hypothetical protein MKEN_00979200 [Mycena kentingensis (nom. inval.)]|nr:hypothetical protein MKEN_00979200 [Mycena kentingensis (nom. inval.)]
MHSSLRRSTLSQLPFRLRLRAQGALATGTADAQAHIDHILDTCDDLHNVNNPPAGAADTLRALLVVPFELLETSSIPALAALDSTALAASLDRVVPALHMLFYMSSAPPAAFADIWPRVWAWLQVLELSLYESKVPDDCISAMLAALVSMDQNTTSRTIARAPMHATAGVVPFLGRIWRYISPLRPSLVDHVDYDYLHGTLITFPWTPDLINELAQDLPRSKKCTCCDKQGSALRSLLPLVTVACTSEDHMVTLRSVGLIKAATKLLERAAAEGESASPLVKKVLKMLTTLLTPSNNYADLPEALEAGLLTTLMKILVDDELVDVPGHLFYNFLGGIIPGAAFHRDNMRALGKVIPALEQLDISALIDSPAEPERMCYEWTSCLDLLRHNLPFVAHNPDEKAMCHNSLCLAIKPRTEFRTCSGCRIALYCDRACRTVAWDAGHRTTCAQDKLTPPPARFLRQIVAQDCFSSLAIAVLDDNQLQKHPQAEPEAHLEGRGADGSREAAISINGGVIPFSRAFPDEEQPTEFSFALYLVKLPDERAADVRLVQKSTEATRRRRVEGLQEVLALIPEGQFKLHEADMVFPDQAYAALLALSAELEREDEFF